MASITDDCFLLKAIRSFRYRYISSVFLLSLRKSSRSLSRLAISSYNRISLYSCALLMELLIFSSRGRFNLSFFFKNGKHIFFEFGPLLLQFLCLVEIFLHFLDCENQMRSIFHFASSWNKRILIFFVNHLFNFNCQLLHFVLKGHSTTKRLLQIIQTPLILIFIFYLFRIAFHYSEQPVKYVSEVFS